MDFKYNSNLGNVALKAMVELVSKINVDKKIICEDNPRLYLKIDMKKSTNPKIHTKFITLPHNIYDESSEIIIVRHDKFSPVSLLKEDGLSKELQSNILKEITIKEFKYEYTDFEAKHQLSQQSDLFVVEKCLHSYIMPLLNKHFLGTSMHPHFINFGNNPTQSYLKIFKQSAVKIRSGSCFSVLFGDVSMKSEQLRDNLNYIVDNIGKFIPGGNLNINMISIFCGAASLSLPVFKSYGLAKDVLIKSMRKKQRVIEAEDVTTVEGAKVRVLQNGEIEIISDGTDLFEKTFELESRQPMSNRARKRAAELQLIKHKEDTLRKYNASLDNEDEAVDEAQLPNDMTVDNGDDDDESEDDSSSEAEQKESEDRLVESDDESAPPAKKSKVQEEVKENIKTPKKSISKTPIKKNNAETPKKAKVTPKSATPKVEKVTPKSATPKVEKVTPKSATPKPTTPKVVKLSPKVAKVTPKVAKVTPKSVTPKVLTPVKPIKSKVETPAKSVKKAKKLTAEEIRKPSPKMLRSRSKLLGNKK